MKSWIMIMTVGALLAMGCTKTETEVMNCGDWWAEQDAIPEDLGQPDLGTTDTETGLLPTGTACVTDDECHTGSCFCGPGQTTDCFSLEATVKSFNPESDWEDMLPGGMCAKFMCNVKKPEVGGDECGPGAYCFNVEALFGAPIGLCLRYCDEYQDCRFNEGYVCYYTGVEGQRACLPASMIPDIPCGDGKCEAPETKDNCPRDCCTEGC